MDLRNFLDELEKRDELTQIDQELSSEFGTSRKLRELDGGPAVIFENIKPGDLVAMKGGRVSVEE